MYIICGIHRDSVNLYGSLGASNLLKPPCRLPQFQPSHRTNIHFSYVIKYAGWKRVPWVPSWFRRVSERDVGDFIYIYIYFINTIIIFIELKFRTKGSKTSHTALSSSEIFFCLFVLHSIFMVLIFCSVANLPLNDTKFKVLCTFWSSNKYFVHFEADL